MNLNPEPLLKSSTELLNYHRLTLVTKNVSESFLGVFKFGKISDRVQ